MKHWAHQQDFCGGRWRATGKLTRKHLWLLQNLAVWSAFWRTTYKLTWMRMLQKHHFSNCLLCVTGRGSLHFTGRVHDCRAFVRSRPENWKTSNTACPAKWIDIVQYVHVARTGSTSKILVHPMRSSQRERSKHPHAQTHIGLLYVKNFTNPFVLAKIILPFECLLAVSTYFFPSFQFYLILQEYTECSVFDFPWTTQLAHALVSRCDQI